MHINRSVLLILACLLIQACASSIDTQRLQVGKMSFLSGDFKTAFRQLLPLAAEGIPQAEYGVGYMYYYGYGVTQDSESGIFWMKKAATARYAPAIRALAAIQNNPVKQEEIRRYPPGPATVQTSSNVPTEDNNIEKKASFEALNNLPTSSTKLGHVTVMAKPEEVTVAKEEPFLSKRVNDDNTLATRPSGKYTLQLLGSYYLASLKLHQAALNLGLPTYIGQTKHNGRDWYVLTYGQYPALGRAELAKLDLPKKIKDFKPWIRKCDELEWVN